MAWLSIVTLAGGDSAAVAPATAVMLSMLAAGALLRGVSYPLNLMPASRRVLLMLPPVGGGLLVWALSLTDAYGIPAGHLLGAVAFAAATAASVAGASRRVLMAHPLRIAVFGSAEFAGGLRRELEATRTHGYEVVGWLAFGSGPTVRPLAEGQIGTVDSVRSTVREHGIDLIVRSPGLEGDQAAYDVVAEACLDLPVRMIEGSMLYESLFGHVPLGTINSQWFLFLMHPRFEGTSRTTKRAGDLLASSIAGLFLLPLLAIAALAIKLEDRGPVLYRQRRLGEGGEPFEILKLRTMREDSELAGPQWSVAADDRVTRVGRILRRTHLDEIPQLLNVLRGEMTLVGPRPERPEHIARLEQMLPHYKRRLLVKPGVTGWAQVRCGYAGSDLGTAWKLCHDLYYLKHESIFADLLIMLETLVTAPLDSHRPIRAPQPDFIVPPAAVAELELPLAGVPALESQALRAGAEPVTIAG